MNMITRRHGWQRPLHPLQIVGMAIYSFLVVFFYTFEGLLLGNRFAEITITTVYTIVVAGVMFLFTRCTAIDPTDRTSFKKKKRPKCRINYGFLLGQIALRFFRRIERKILRTLIRRKYFDPSKIGTDHLVDPLLPFPFALRDDAVTPNPKEDDISFCSFCDCEVKKNSKHCRTCNRCVEGFDHHCRWLNNCVGKKNYTTFFLLMIFVLLMLIVEGGSAIAVFIRCFADKNGTEQELKRRFYIEFPRWLLAVISVLLFFVTAYGSAALGQLFFFHVVLLRKGMRTYDYILAMKEVNQSIDLLDPLDDSGFSSDESTDFDSPEQQPKSNFLSRFICRGQGVNQNPTRLSIRIEGDHPTSKPSSPLNKKKSFHVGIDPWKLIKLSKEKALLAADKARERIDGQKPTTFQNDPLHPLPLETKCGALMNVDRNVTNTTGLSLTPAKANFPLSPGRFSSPRKRFSSSPKNNKYRSNFDLKLTEVSRELETYISRQVLCSVIKEDGAVPSPR